MAEETFAQDLLEDAPAIRKDEEYYDKIRQQAYLNWLVATGGNTLPEDPEGLQFWLKAEQEVAAEGR